MGIKNADTKICSAVTRHADKLGRCKYRKVFWNLFFFYLFFSITGCIFATVT